MNVTFLAELRIHIWSDPDVSFRSGFDYFRSDPDLDFSSKDSNLDQVFSSGSEPGPVGKFGTGLF